MGKQYQVDILVQHTSIHQSYSNVGNMRSVLFITIFAITFNALSGLECKYDSECLTLDDMGAGWGGFFNGAANAPCLTMSWSKGADDLWCFNSKGGSLKPCTCWDDTLSFDNKWCNTGKYKEGHTMCKYEDSVQASCGSYTLTGIDSQAVKDAIVDKHNELRARVANGKEKLGVDGRQPKAANMRQLVWNDELAEIAQRWINQCAGAHDKNRRTDEFSWVGQNWAMSSNGNKDQQQSLATSFVQMWYDEVKDMSKKALTDPTGKNNGKTGVIGHYTQVVWAETTDVGCGYIASSKGSYMACNYGPGGNVAGKRVYETGKPGSKCPTKKTSQGLCA